MLARAHADAAGGAIVLTPPAPVEHESAPTATVAPTTPGPVVARLDRVSARHSGRTVLDAVDLIVRARLSPPDPCFGGITNDDTT